MMNSRANAVARGFPLEFDPLPFADGVVVAKDAAARRATAIQNLAERKTP